MLRRVDTARLVHRPGFFGKGAFVLEIGRRSALVGNRRKWNRSEVQEFHNYSLQWPAFVAQLDGRNYWSHAGRIFSENEGLNQEQVNALLISRDQRNRRQIDRAVAMVQRGAIPASVQRASISDEVKQYVWQRDGGRCLNCGANTELQFDHVIPLAMGGSNEPENLQLLCGPCNRMKGGGLTTRGMPSGPKYG